MISLDVQFFRQKINGKNSIFKTDLDFKDCFEKRKINMSYCWTKQSLEGETSVL